MSATLKVTVDKPHLLGSICGPNDRNLAEIARLFASPVRTRGNEIHLESSNKESRVLFRNLMNRIMEIADRNEVVGYRHIRSMFAALESGDRKDIEGLSERVLTINGGTRKVYPQGSRQTAFVRSMSEKDLTIGIGPAGTGKTYLAVAHALMELLSRRKRKIILTRPVVESGENLGFLPGDLTQKLAPYLHPLYDAMEELIPLELLERLRDNGQIEVAPLAYMRGRSLSNCYIVLDEAQNTTVEQMKMFLTRIAEGSRAVVIGDITQIDLPIPNRSGLIDAVRTLRKLDDIGVIEFHSDDVVRHPLVKKIIDAYESQKESSS